MNEDEQNMRNNFVLTFIIILTILCSGCHDEPPAPNTGNPPPAPPTPTVTFLAAGIPQIEHLQSRGEYLYWTDETDMPIKRLSKTTGSITPIAPRMGVPGGIVVRQGFLYWVDIQSGVSPSGCTGLTVIGYLKKTSALDFQTSILDAGDLCSGGGLLLAADENHLYWVNSVSSPNISRIKKVAFNGGGSTVLLEVPTTARGIVALAVDASHLYWEVDNSPDTSTIMRMRKSDGGGVEVLATATGEPSVFGGLVLQDTLLFFGISDDDDHHRIMAFSTPSASMDTLLSIDDPTATKRPQHMVADPDWLYWEDGNSLNAVSLGNGSVRTVTTAVDAPLGLAINDNQIVWTEYQRPNGLLKRVDKSGGTPVTLADHLNEPGLVVSDGQDMYWGEGAGAYGVVEGFGRIARISINGGSAVTVATGVSSTGTPITVDDEYLYFGDKFILKKVPVDGGVVEEVCRAEFYFGDIITDGDFVYWTEDPFCNVRKVPVGGGTIVTLAGGNGLAGPIKLSGNDLYWLEGNTTIRAVPKTGGTAVTIATNIGFISHFAVDSTGIYYAEDDSGHIMRISTAGGTRTLLATETPEVAPNVLALDNYSLYWINQSHISKILKSSGAASRYIPQGLLADPFHANEIAIDDSCVYWTETLIGAVKKGTPK